MNLFILSRAGEDALVQRVLFFHKNVVEFIVEQFRREK